MERFFYRYFPVPPDDGDDSNNLMLWNQWLLVWVVFLLLVLVVALLVPLIFFAIKANSQTCKNGLQAEQECRNITHLPEHQLPQAPKSTLQTEDTCNQTVETLKASLKTEKAQGLRLQELQKEIETLKEKQHNTTKELEQLRKDNKGIGRGDGSTSSGNTLSFFLVTMFLILILQALLA